MKPPVPAAALALLAAAWVSGCITMHTVENYELRGSDLEPPGVRALVWHAPEPPGWLLAFQMDGVTEGLEHADLSDDERQAAVREAQRVRDVTLPASPELVAELGRACSSVSVLLAEDASPAERRRADELLAALADHAPRLHLHRIVTRETPGRVADLHGLQVRLKELRAAAKVSRPPREWRSVGFGLVWASAHALFVEDTVTLVAPLSDGTGRFAVGHGPLLTTDPDRDPGELPLEARPAADVLAWLGDRPDDDGSRSPLVLVAVPWDAPAAVRAACAELAAAMHTQKRLEWTRVIWWPVGLPFEELSDPEQVRTLVRWGIAYEFEILSWVGGGLERRRGSAPDEAP